MSLETKLHVDDRWSGNHGIGRYAGEVLPRLTVSHELMRLTGRPSDPLDAMRHRGIARGSMTYSPGYNAFLGGGRQFITIHDLIHLTTPGLGRLKYTAYYNQIVRPVVRRAGMVFTDSEASARSIRSWLADDDVRIVNAAAGCSPVFRPGGVARDFERPTFVSIGNMRPHKNMATFLRAIKLTEYGAALIIPPGEADEFRRLVQEIGVEDRVELTAGVSDEDLAAMYRGAVGTAFPSLLEGFGLPALESVRAGTPVVFWRGCESVAEIVGVSGVGVESPSDPRKWADALDAVVSGVEVVQPPIDAYTWESTAAIVDRALREALTA